MKTLLLFFMVAAAALGRDASVVGTPLEPIGFWAGATWRGQLPPPPGGGAAPALETTFAWMENGKVLRFDTVAVAGDKRRPYVSGIYTWHPGRKVIVFRYADGTGALTDGTATVDGGVLAHEFTVTDAMGAETAYRSRITRDGNDAYWNEIFHQENGEWKAFVKVRYERGK